MTMPARVSVPLAAVGGVAVLALVVAAPLGAYNTGGAVFAFSFAVPLYAIGLFAYLKRPDLPIARLLLAVGAVAALGTALEGILRAVFDGEGPVQALWPLAVLDAVLVLALPVLGATFVALFPDGVAGRPYERRAVRAMWLVPLAPLFELVTSPVVQMVPTEEGESYELSSPLAIPGLEGLAEVPQAVSHAAGLLFVAGIVLLFLRYRRVRDEQRLQIRMLLVVAGGTVILAEVGFAVWTPAGIAVAVAGYPLLLVSVLVAILRYRLLDVDLLIRRSLVYGVLWVLIVVAYVAAAAALGIAASGELPVSAAILITILATLAFQPARRQLETLADRWVFGERLGGYELLTRFGATLEETFDPDELFARLAETVKRGLRVRWARVLVRRPAGDTYVLDPQAAAGIEPDAATEASVAVPLVHAGEPLGSIEVGPKEAGELSDEDRTLLETLARQAAIAIRNARLASDLSMSLDEIRYQAELLRASRKRIVHAQDTERRRIERNIHDGVQQELVALIAKLRLARNQLARDVEPSDRTLAEVQEEAGHVLENLRELVQGIHPSVLSDRGLVDAIDARAARMPVPVAVRADVATRSARFEDEVEAAAYFVVSEALANALKHADAGRIDVTISHDGARLALDVRDDGRGFEPGEAGSGLANMDDRVEALGGRLTVRSRPGEGTRISARLPAAAREPAHA